MYFSAANIKNLIPGAKLSSGGVIRLPESSLPGSYRSSSGRAKKGKHDNSIAIFIDPRAHGGFRVHSHRAISDGISWKDKHREICLQLGIEPWKPRPKSAPRHFRPRIDYYAATRRLCLDRGTITPDQFAILASE
jgi:hypothetical protein